ncbi:MAG: hypothetical protein C0592_07235 [Marinilabiliales bacterium]|nr:MAG: hypothetical protein C0592_07235 [Marinilabiliales bacterium]
MPLRNYWIMKTKLQISAILVLLTAMVGVGISYGPLYAFHVAGFAFLILFVLKLRQNLTELPFLKKKLHFLHVPLFMIVWYALSILWSTDRALAVNQVFYLLNAFLIFLAAYFAIRDRSDIRRFLFLAGILAAIEILISFLEAGGIARWPISPYSDLVELFRRSIGYNPNMDAEIIAAINKTPTGFHWNPNDLAAYMLMIIPFFLFSKRIWIKIVFPIAALSIILLTGSRAVLIGVALMAFFYVFLYQTRKNILIISGVFAFLVIAFLIARPYLKEKYEVKYREISTTTDAALKFFTTDHELVNDTSSIAIRQNLIENGMHAFKESYGLGVGGGNSQVVQKESDNTHGIFSMHNFWIEILVEGGALVFGLWVVWYFLLLRRSYLWWRRKIPEENRRLSAAVSLSMIGAVIAIISISSAIYFLPFWLLLALAVRMNDLNRNQISGHFGSAQ